MFNNPEFAAQLAQLAVALVSFVASILLPLVSARIVQYTGVKIEEKHMRVLHEAATTWARGAVLNGLKASNANAARDLEKYIKKSAPDAIKALAPDFQVLEKLAERYMGQARAEQKQTS